MNPTGHFDLFGPNLCPCRLGKQFSDMIGRFGTSVGYWLGQRNPRQGTHNKLVAIGKLPIWLPSKRAIVEDNKISVLLQHVVVPLGREGVDRITKPDIKILNGWELVNCFVRRYKKFKRSGRGLKNSMLDNVRFHHTQNRPAEKLCRTIFS